MIWDDEIDENKGFIHVALNWLLGIAKIICKTSWTPYWYLVITVFRLGCFCVLFGKHKFLMKMQEASITDMKIP